MYKALYVLRFSHGVIVLCCWDLKHFGCFAVKKNRLANIRSFAPVQSETGLSHRWIMVKQMMKF